MRLGWTGNCEGSSTHGKLSVAGCKRNTYILLEPRPLAKQVASAREWYKHPATLEQYRFSRRWLTVDTCISFLAKRIHWNSLAPWLAKRHWHCVNRLFKSCAMLWSCPVAVVITGQLCCTCSQHSKQRQGSNPTNDVIVLAERRWKTVGRFCVSGVQEKYIQISTRHISCPFCLPFVCWSRTVMKNQPIYLQQPMHWCAERRIESASLNYHGSQDPASALGWLPQSVFKTNSIWQFVLQATKIWGNKLVLQSRVCSSKATERKGREERTFAHKNEIHLRCRTACSHRYCLEELTPTKHHGKHAHCIHVFRRTIIRVKLVLPAHRWQWITQWLESHASVYRV